MVRKNAVNTPGMGREEVEEVWGKDQKLILGDVPCEVSFSIQAEVSRGQLDIHVWSSDDTSGLEIDI